MHREKKLLHFRKLLGEKRFEKKKNLLFLNKKIVCEEKKKIWFKKIIYL